VAHANKAKQTKEFLKQLVVQTAPKATHPSYTTTLHLKIRPEAWPWLDQAAREVNQVWNWANATSLEAIQGPRATPRWLSSVDLCALAVGAGECFERIGSDAVQRVLAEYVGKRTQFKKAKLRFRASGGSKRALGWIPFKAANLRVNGHRLTFFGKTLRLFQMERFLEYRDPQKARMRSGNFAQNSLGEWFLNVSVDVFHPEATVFTEQGLPVLDVAPQAEVGIDPGLETVVATSDGEMFEPNRSYRELEPEIAQAQKRGHKKQSKRLHLKAKNQRANHTHAISNHLIATYQNLYLGNVSSAFLRSGNHGKSACDGGWGMLKAQLHYKGHRAGRSVHDVDEKHTSQACSGCGALTGPAGRTGLAVRTWTCSSCNAVHARDVNSAKNMLPSAPMRRRPSAGTR